MFTQKNRNVCCNQFTNLFAINVGFTLSRNAASVKDGPQ